MDIRPPDPVLSILDRLWASGHAGYVVGGSLRDLVIDREPADWDLATDARPDRLVEIFPGAVYENRFGTVAVRQDGADFEITTFRSDHDYADFRRPHRVEFGDTIEVDLARRDFTINALAWGADAPSPGADGLHAPPTPGLIDAHGGLADIEARSIRAVGDPILRFQEDALRMVRAVRLATTLEFVIEPATLDAIRANAPLVAHLSGERLATELDNLLQATHPSIGLRLLAQTGILAVISPELASQRGIPQNKIPGEDLWDHTVRTVDAVPEDRPVVRLAALLHDIGKPSTMADEHFHGHDTVGAELAAAFLGRLRTPRTVADRVVNLIRHHMFVYDPSWGDAGVRRFMRRIGREQLTSLFELREADNEGSGDPRNAFGLDELRTRVAEQLAGPVVMERGDLAISGGDLMRELKLTEGPVLGRILDELLDRAITDPVINDPPTLLLLAQAMLTEDR